MYYLIRYQFFYISLIPFFYIFLSERKKHLTHSFFLMRVRACVRALSKYINSNFIKFSIFGTFT